MFPFLFHTDYLIERLLLSHHFPHFFHFPIVCVCPVKNMLMATATTVRKEKGEGNEELHNAACLGDLLEMLQHIANSFDYNSVLDRLLFF